MARLRRGEAAAALHRRPPRTRCPGRPRRRPTQRGVEVRGTWLPLL